MSDLRERVARLYIDKWGLSDYWLADAAIDLVLEEAARVADEVRHPNWSAENEDWCAGTEAAAAAIRALKSGNDS